MPKKLEIAQCAQCPHHAVRPDPDPQDWFNDDDVRVECTKVNRNVRVALRPYEVKEVKIPKWCPL